MTPFAFLAFFVVLSLVLRFFWVMRTPRRSGRIPRRILVVLGSGGHTGEMMLALRHQPRHLWGQAAVRYVVAQTDHDSSVVAERFEMAEFGRRANVSVIPRAREVGQRYITSIWTTLTALASALLLVYDESPDVILTNGPGVCVPIVLANILVALLLQGRERATIAYLESFTCVTHLSLSGKIILPFADLFTVQWPPLYESLTRRWSTTLRYTGPFSLEGADLTSPNGRLLLHDGVLGGAGSPRRTLVITVGSTNFDELISAVNTFQFFDALIVASINHVIVQKGRGSATITYKVPTTLIQLEVVDYRPHLAEVIRGAALVISHAGAGTILECLGAGVPLIVVPNERLMSNHQLELAQALAAQKVLSLCTSPDLLVSAIQQAPWKELRPFPPPNVAALQKHITGLVFPS